MRYRQIRVIAGKGSGPGQFAESLRGIALDEAGRLYTVGDSAVKVFDTNGKLLRHWQTTRPGYCVVVDSDGTVWVGQEGRIARFDAAGNRQHTWEDEARLGRVTAIGFADKSVLIADAQNRCIRRYDRGGRRLNDIGQATNTRGFLIPNGHLDLVVDAKGVIHVAHPGKFRVERYSLSGELLGMFGHFGMRRPEDFPGCCNPTNLTRMRDGRIVVTEKAGPRVKVYDADGKLISVVAADAFDPNCRNMDVAADDKGTIYVADTVRLHICVLAPEGGSETPASAPAAGRSAKVDTP